MIIDPGSIGGDLGSIQGPSAVWRSGGPEGTSRQISLDAKGDSEQAIVLQIEQDRHGSFF